MDDNQIYFKVKDSGIGVPKKDQKHLFTQFYRAKNAQDVRPDGTGVGLFLSKEIIESHGGNILYENNPSGGSIFGFSLSVK